MQILKYSAYEHYTIPPTEFRDTCRKRNAIPKQIPAVELWGWTPLRDAEVVVPRATWRARPGPPRAASTRGGLPALVRCKPDDLELESDLVLLGGI